MENVIESPIPPTTGRLRPVYVTLSWVAVAVMGNIFVTGLLGTSRLVWYSEFLYCAAGGLALVEAALISVWLGLGETKLPRRLTVALVMLSVLLASFFFGLNLFTPSRWYAQTQLAVTASIVLFVVATSFSIWCFANSRQVVLSRSAKLSRGQLDQRFELWHFFVAMTLSALAFSAFQFFFGDVFQKQGPSIFLTDLKAMSAFIVVLGLTTFAATGFVFAGERNGVAGFGLIGMLSLSPVVVEFLISLEFRDREVSMFGPIRHEIMAGIDVHFVANAFLFVVCFAGLLIAILSAYKAAGIQLIELEE